MKKIKASLVGSTGYAGQELLRILNGHEGVEIANLSSQSYVGKKYSSVFPNFRGVFDQECAAQDILKFSKESDVIFLALPHGIATKEVTAEVLSNARIIDIGADFRLKDIAVYEKFYGLPHHAPDLLKEAVYGLPEITDRKTIKNARLIANPGCYATASIMSLAPFLKAGVIEAGSVIVDAKSGVSGAGRTLDTGSLFCEANESLKAYKIASHRHTPEIEQALAKFGGGNITFTPHLVPMNRGILVTAYAKIKKDFDPKKVLSDFYKGEEFVRVLESESAETKNVKGSNLFDVSAFLDRHTGRLIITGAIDNLVKGASGQAVQNMNIMFGFKENTGLKNLGMLL